MRTQTEKPYESFERYYNMQKLLTITGILGATAVIIGAFGSHGIAPHLTDNQINTFNIASKYHFYHTLAVLGMAILYPHMPDKRWVNRAAYAFIGGIILFSGSLYLLACKDILQLGTFTKIIGPITPIGGLAFILGWIILLLSAKQTRK